MPSLDRAEILVQALPYIQKYFGKTVVIKYGGNAMVSETLKDAVMTDVTLLSLVGVQVVLVHGGGPEIDDMLRRLNKQPEFIGGLRRTDAETMDVVQMVLCGKVNKDLARLLERHGGKALGLSGMDAGLIEARQASPELGLVGEITRVNPRPIIDALAAGYIPVIATVACGEGDVHCYNINADTAASRIAAELKAEKLLLMTDIRGLLRDKNDESTLIPEVSVSDVNGLKRQGIITGGMIPKIDCCVEAVRRGVKTAQISDGRVPHSILIEMLTDEGVGTLFR